jgi:ParB family chromosome partitioning protein
MAKLKGLGRGLDALLGGDETPAPQPGDSMRDLKIDQLQPGKYQPRTRMDQESLQQLSDSIKAQGIMQPILVRQISPEKYEIIAGERRWRASRLAGLTTVPVIVREVPDEAALAMSLIENIQRESLNPLEEATGIQRLINEFEMTHQAAAEAVGRSRSAVTNLLRLLNLAKQVQTMLMDSQLDMGHARALLALDEPRQLQAAHQIIHKGLSVREAERLVQKLLQNKTAQVHSKPNRDVARLEEEMSEILGTQVQIKHSKSGKGKLIINYGSLDNLEVYLNKLK